MLSRLDNPTLTLPPTTSITATFWMQHVPPFVPCLPFLSFALVGGLLEAPAEARVFIMAPEETTGAEPSPPLSVHYKTYTQSISYGAHNTYLGEHQCSLLVV